MAPEATPSASGSETPLQKAHRNRLLRDITEMQQKPYPGIQLTPIDLTQACLVLTTEHYPPLHLSILFGDRYPLDAPRVTIQSRVRHPNVFSNYICASILNTAEGYTPAYTLKGICIQLLSFFNSDSLEQSYGETFDLVRYRNTVSEYKTETVNTCGRESCGICRSAVAAAAKRNYKCSHCAFDTPTSEKSEPGSSSSSTESKEKEKKKENSVVAVSRKASENGAQKRALLEASIDSLPDEILLETLENVDFEDLTAFAQAWPRVRRIVEGYDLIRSRELQCFTMKDGYKVANLGIGIAFTPAGRIPRVDSEFDLVSYEAFQKLKVRKSVHGIPYEQWLPLPISHRHWYRVRGAADIALGEMAWRISKPRGGFSVTSVGVIFTFMNDIVVRLNLDLERQQGRKPRSSRWPFDLDFDDEHVSMDAREKKSTLRHASEKAIESYFHLFHLLVCLATGPHGEEIVHEANRMIRSFLKGRRGKQHVPNLGHLLTAMHISDVEVTDELRKAIITEAITRNAVWLLDGRGAGMAELGYLETDAVSKYRLKKTFQGSRTSYRLLMFSELFRRVARPHHQGTSPKPSLAQVRDGLFARHGAPPVGAAAFLAGEVRRLQQIDAFPPFLAEMGLRTLPSAQSFTAALRETVRASVRCGYSRDVPAYSLLSLRMLRDKEMNTAEALRRIWTGGANWQYSKALADKAAESVRLGRLTFFPDRIRR